MIVARSPGPKTPGIVNVIGLMLGALGRIFAPQLLSLYLKEGGDAVRYGQIRMNYVCLLYFLCGIMDVMSGALRGMGKSTVPMVVTIIGACGLRIVWIYTVFKAAAHLAVEERIGVLFAVFPVSWLVTICALLVCFLMIWKKRLKLPGNE